MKPRWGHLTTNETQPEVLPSQPLKTLVFKRLVLVIFEIPRGWDMSGALGLHDFYFNRGSRVTKCGETSEPSGLYVLWEWVSSEVSPIMRAGPCNPSLFPNLS